MAKGSEQIESGNPVGRYSSVRVLKSYLRSRDAIVHTFIFSCFGVLYAGFLDVEAMVAETEVKKQSPVSRVAQGCGGRDSA